MKSALCFLIMILIFLSSNGKINIWNGICPKGCQYNPGGKPLCSCPKPEYDPCSKIKGWGSICPCGCSVNWKNGLKCECRKTKPTTRHYHWAKSINKTNIIKIR